MLCLQALRDTLPSTPIRGRRPVDVSFVRPAIPLDHADWSGRRRWSRVRNTAVHHPTATTGFGSRGAGRHLPGCVALGETVDECLAEMRDAVALYLDVLRERGEEVPQPRVIQAVTVTPTA